MSLPLDDAQVTRHVFRQLAEHTGILRQELINEGFSGELLEKMIMVWWGSMIRGAHTPDFESILKGLLGEGEE